MTTGRMFHPLRKRAELALLLIYALSSWKLAGAAPAAGGSSAADHPTRIVATRVKLAPRLDGTLHDPLWQQAEAISDFRQREPYEGTAPSEKTEVRVLYDSRHVYFGIRCYDSDPRGIVAAQLRRDLEMALDDSFAVLIDPSQSRRNGYVFQINPLGTQRDGLITEEQSPAGDGEVVDPNWDGVWTSAAAVDDQGWTATIEIPFSTLNFKAGSDVTWGINFRRFIRRKNEEDLWSAYRRIYGLSRISEAGELTGITDIERARLLVLKPYGLAGFRRLDTQNTEALYTGGLDVKIGLRNNLVANLTFNTDFADTDVDQQQFNLTPFRVLIPEKRQFFLENSDVFDFHTDFDDMLFFSRQIGVDPVSGQVVPIDLGAKIAGTLGGLDLGILSVKTRPQGPNAYADYNVLRVKWPFLDDGYLGVMAVDKESGNALDPFNRALGVDGRAVLFKHLTVLGFAAKTKSPNLHGKDYTAGVRASFRSNLVKAMISHATIQPNYNPEVGYVNLADDKPAFFDVNLTPRPRLRGVRELSLEAFLDHNPTTQNVLQFQQWQMAFRAFFNNGAYTDNDLVDNFYYRLFTPFNIYKHYTIPVGGYHFLRHQVSFGSPENRRLTASLRERWGGFYTGRLNELSLTSQYRPNARLSLGLTNGWNAFRLPQGNFDVNLAGLQVSYAFSRFLNASTFAQIDTAQTQAASVNFRVRYTYRPDSDVYIVYNAGTRFQSLAADNPLQLREQRLVVKFTYSFSL